MTTATATATKQQRRKGKTSGKLIYFQLLTMTTQLFDLHSTTISGKRKSEREVKESDDD